MTEQELSDIVRTAVIEALAVEPEQAKPETTLFGDLEAESIDLLDILFRVERRTGIKVRSAEISAYIRGDIPEGGFADETGYVSRRGLKKSMPQIDEEALYGKLLPEDIIKLFNMRNLVALLLLHDKSAAPVA